MKKRNLFFYAVIILSLAFNAFLAWKFHSFETRQKELLDTVTTLESQVYQFVPFTPRNADITGIYDHSRLKATDSHNFSGEFSIWWDEIPNASGYEIEFNYTRLVDNVKSSYYRCTGAFDSYDINISDVKFRIRAYGLQDDEKIFGEFSDWVPLEIEYE